MTAVKTKGLSFRSKITLYAVVMSIIILGLAAFINNALFRAQLKKTISIHQQAEVYEFANHIEERLVMARRQIELIAGSIKPRDLKNPALIQRLLDSEESARAMFDGGLVVISSDLRLIAESPYRPNRRGMDFSYREYARQALETGQPVISNPYRSTAPPNDPHIAFAVPIKNADGTVAGLLAGRYNLLTSSFLQSISNISIKGTGYLYVFSKNRRVIVHPDRTLIGEPVKEGTNLGYDRAISEGFDGSIENKNIYGIGGISSFKHLKQCDWILGSHVPFEEIYAPIHESGRMFVFIYLMLALLSWLVIWNVLGKLMSPLQTVIDHIGAFHLKQGDSRLLPETLSGDLGQLGAVFNTMVEEFDGQQEALRIAGETYRIVAEFTAEIAFWREPDGAVKFISSNCLELSGYTENEFYARPDLLDRIVHPDYQEFWEGHTHEYDERSGKPLHFDLMIITKEGEYRWVSHTCHQVFSKDGKILGVRGNFTDITKLRRMQEEMKDQKNFAENLLDKAAVPLTVISADHRVLVWNSAMADLTGCRSVDMVGTNRQWRAFYDHERPILADIIISTDYSVLEQFYSNRTSSLHVDGGIQAEGWFDNMDGQRRYLFFDAAPIINNRNEIVAAVETIQDITVRKQAEDEQRKLSWAVSENPCSIVITDSSGAIEYVNRKFCEVTGYTAEEALGRNPRILKSGETSPAQYDDMWQTVSAGKTWHGEFHNRKKNGELYWELASISPIINDQGDITHYLAVKEDITQRKVYEAELAKGREDLQHKHNELSELFTEVENSKREWEDTMDSLSEMVLICDQWGVVRRCNRAVCAFAMLSYEQLVGIECLELFSRVGMEISGYDGKSGQLVFDGGRRHFELLSNTLKQIGSDDIRGIVVTIHETTELLKMNEELQNAYAELQQTQAQIFQQEKMASIGQLAAGVAHEINNPMGFISSNLSTMGKYMEKINAFETAMIEAVQGTGDADTVSALNELRKRMKIDFILEDIKSLLEESRDGAERVRRIVQDLKSFSHVDEAECKAVSINECLDTTLNMLRNEIKYVADVEREYDPDLPMLFCFPQQINQVFMNILVNSAHAIEGHGIIKVKTFREADHAVIRLGDTGKGIAPENLTRIFEPFFTTKEVGKGTGLGLSISYDIIKKHGGVMDVESELGVGTAFTIRLPLNHPIEGAGNIS